MPFNRSELPRPTKPRPTKLVKVCGRVSSKFDNGLCFEVDIPFFDGIVGALHNGPKAHTKAEG